MTAIATFGGLSLDARDARGLAEFYRQVTGWDVAHESDEYVLLQAADGKMLGLVQVAGHQPPGWPDDAKQAHLDF